MLQRTRLGQKVAGSNLRGGGKDFPLRVISSQVHLSFLLELDVIINSFSVKYDCSK